MKRTKSLCSLKSIICPLPRSCGWHGYLEDCVNHIKRDHLEVTEESKYVNVIHRNTKSFTFNINARFRLNQATDYACSLFVPWVAMLTWKGHNFIFHCTFKKYEETYYIGIRIIGNEEQAEGFTFFAKISGDAYFRNFGPFPVKSIGNGSYNETDFMSVTAKEIRALYQTNLTPGLLRAFRLSGKICLANAIEYRKAVENFQQRSSKKTKRVTIKKRSKASEDDEDDESDDELPPKPIGEPSDPLSLVTSSSARNFALPSFEALFQASATTSGTKNHL